MGRVNRYCVQCGGRLTYYPLLSNPKAENNDRTMVYGCLGKCTKDAEKPVLIAIQTLVTNDPIRTMKNLLVKPKDSD